MNAPGDAAGGSGSSAESWLEVQVERLLDRAEEEELAADGAGVMGGVAALLDRAEAIRDLRAVKGRGLGTGVRGQLEQLRDRLGAVHAMLAAGVPARTEER